MRLRPTPAALRASLALGLAAALAGCEGFVLDGPSRPDRGVPDPYGDWRPTSPDAPTDGVMDPGRVTMRRLNRTELDHTLRDLLLLDHEVSTDFPADDRGYGYDTIGDVLSTSALHVELLAKEAESWVAEGIGSADAPGPARERFFTCDLATDGDRCAREILEGFALRAWRRPAAPAELARLTTVASLAREHDRPLEEGVELAMVAVLVSPHFLFRPEPLATEPSATATPARPIGDFALASRLSYFLWASTPDDELLDLAARGALDDDAVLAAQIERMLADPRARSLTDDFAGQWLWTRLVSEHTVDASVFADWDAALARSARRELELTFQAFLAEDRPVSELMTADFSFVDARLAAHYGIEAPAGDDFARVTMPPERRAGLLARAGILAVTSQPNRTSPVKRGVWVLEQLLCTHPPPPPPDVEGFDATEPRPGETLRQRFERHRADPVCASCHALMDPIGFGLERFDGIGRYRETESGTTIDDSGVLLGGIEFAGAVELSQRIAEDPRFSRCVSQQLMTYALGRGMRRADEVWVHAVTERAEAEGGSLRDVITQIVLSPPFRSSVPEVTP